MLDFECFEGVDYIFLVFVVLMFSKDLVFFGGLVDDSWIYKWVVRVIIWEFVELILILNINLIYDK